MRLVLARLVRLVLVLLAVTAASFSMISLLPGDTVDSVLGAKASAQDREKAREELHLNDPLPVRYVSWLSHATQGDLGKSYRTKQPVAEAIQQRIGLTLELVVLSQLIALLIATPMAVASALRPGKWLDQTSSALSLGMLAAPAYMLAVGMLAVFSAKLHWFSPTGFTRISEDVLDHFRTLTLPSLALALPEVAIYMRLLRSELINTFQQDYIWFARAKGLGTGAIVRRHALRPSSVGVITVAGVTMGRMIGGTVMVESIFALPGLGGYTIDAITHRDFLSLQGAIVVFTVAFVIINFLVDILYGVLDPRTRI